MSPTRSRRTPPNSRGQVAQAVVGGPRLRTAVRTVACSALVSFSVTICFRAAVPSAGLPIFGFRLRFTLVRLLRLMLVVLSTKSIGVTVFPKISPIKPGCLPPQREHPHKASIIARLSTLSTCF